MKFVLAHIPLTVLLIISFNQSALAYKGTDAGKLLNFMQSYRQDFCKSGSTFSKTIRSDSGKYCREQLGAALALHICQGNIQGFGGSQCETNAKNLLQKMTPQSELQFHEPAKTCEFIGQFLGRSFIDSCNRASISLEVNKPLPPPPVKPVVAPPQPAPPPPAKKLADVVVWDKQDFEDLLFEFGVPSAAKNRIKDNTGIDPNEKRALLDQHVSGAKAKYFASAITASDVAKINGADLGNDNKKASLVFAKLSPSLWADPIPGEVKYINGLRYQFITADPKDNYSVLVVCKKFSDAEFRGNFTIKAPSAMLSAKGSSLGAGGKGEVFKLDYKGRHLAIKSLLDPQRASDSYVNKEVRNYEQIYEKIPKANLTYVGYLNDDIDVHNFGSGKKIMMLLKLGENMPAYLKRSDKNTIDKNFKPMLSFMQTFHNQGFLHNDIKIENYVVVDGVVTIIDLDNMDKKGMVKRGDGFTFPYYTIGEQFGIEADLKALGFTLFAMRYFNDTRPDYAAKFTMGQKEKYLDNALVPADIISLLTPTADKIDQVIIKLLKQEYKNAGEAVRDL